MTDRCPCGGIILADTEEWKTPLCHECWVPWTRLDVPLLQEENRRLQAAKELLQNEIGHLRKENSRLAKQEYREGFLDTQVEKLRSLLERARKELICLCHEYTEMPCVPCDVREDIDAALGEKK